MKYPPVQYHDYLKLDQILNAQQRRSEEFNNPAHDEMLFIIVHQTYELWFKQIIFELDSVLSVFKRNRIEDRELGEIAAHLRRLVEIQKLINGQVDVLETMTPLDFLDFRDYLYPASGFQSFQWKAIETKLGLKPAQRLQYTQGQFYSTLTAAQQTQMKSMLEEPSLLECIEKWLERTPFLQDKNFDFWANYKSAAEQMFADDEKIVQNNNNINPEQKEKTFTQLKMARESFAALFDEKKWQEYKDQGHFKLSYKALQAALFIQMYRNEPILQLPYQIISSLIDIDEKLTEWRSKHALMVHRMLGKKIGTGGSSGHDYLKGATDQHKIFADFFNLATFFIPRSRMPQLPVELKRKMSFTDL